MVIDATGSCAGIHQLAVTVTAISRSVEQALDSHPSFFFSPRFFFLSSSKSPTFTDVRWSMELILTYFNLLLAFFGLPGSAPGQLSIRSSLTSKFLDQQAFFFFKAPVA